MKFLGITLEQVNELREFGNGLLKTSSVEDVVLQAFEKIEEELFPQVCSIFLFSKDGTLKRYKINGVDRYGLKIEDSWLPNEEYLPGESFSGRAAAPEYNDINSSYGKTYWSNNLEDESSKFINGRQYKEKLGLLKCGISVPLNGTHRTFGTLEILNKKGSKNSTKAEDVMAFSESEVCWLTVLGSHVSAAISRIRKKDEDKIYTNISRSLANPENRTILDNHVYKSITDQFVGELMPYKACLIREGHGDKLFVVERSKTEDISFTGKGLEPRSIYGCIVGDAYRSKLPIIIKDAKKEIDRFHSSDWISSQKLRSFICFPLTIQGESVGTISLFTGYVHEFTENDLDFLENISYLIAAYIVGVKRALDSKAPKFEWNKRIIEELNPDDNKVLVALSNPQWDFRTAIGIANETGLKEIQVKSILEKYVGEYVRHSLTPDANGNLLYTLKSRPHKRREKLAFLRFLISKSVFYSFATKRGA